MLLVACGAIELQAIDGVALAAGERRILRLEVCVERLSGSDRLVKQFALACRMKVRRGYFEPAVAIARSVAQLCDARLDHRLQLGIGMRFERQDGRLEHVAAE